MKYGYSKKVDLTFDETVQKVTEELQKEGFGILTEIDVQKTMKKKLDADVNPYIILGACNPPFAYKALQSETELGLLMPCNVIVYENDAHEVITAAVEVDAMLSVVDNPAMADYADQIKERLHKAIDAV